VNGFGRKENCFFRQAFLEASSHSRDTKITLRSGLRARIALRSVGRPFPASLRRTPRDRRVPSAAPALPWPHGRRSRPDHAVPARAQAPRVDRAASFVLDELDGALPGQIGPRFSSRPWRAIDAPCGRPRPPAGMMPRHVDLVVSDVVIRNGRPDASSRRCRPQSRSQGALRVRYAWDALRKPAEKPAFSSPWGPPEAVHAEASLVAAVKKPCAA